MNKIWVFIYFFHSQCKIIALTVWISKVFSFTNFYLQSILYISFDRKKPSTFHFYGISPTWQRLEKVKRFAWVATKQSNWSEKSTKFLFHLIKSLKFSKTVLTYQTLKKWKVQAFLFQISRTIHPNNRKWWRCKS